MKLAKVLLGCAIAAWVVSSEAHADFADLSQVMIDVSPYNNLPEILKHTSDRRIELVFARTGLGLGSPDSSFADDLRLLRGLPAQMLMGAYHALYPTHGGREQARDFLNIIKAACLPGDKLLLAVDWEHPKLAKKEIQPASVEILQDFVDEPISLTKRTPIIYTDPSVITPVKAQLSGLASTPLWLATYYSKLSLDRNCKKPDNNREGLVCTDSIHGLLFPEVNDFEPWNDWTFWQFSEAGKGDPEYVRRKLTKDMHVDASFYGGSRDEFRKFFEDHAVKCEDIAALN